MLSAEHFSMAHGRQQLWQAQLKELKNADVIS